MKAYRKTFGIGRLLVVLAYLASVGGLRPATMAVLTTTEKISVPGANLAAIAGGPRCDLDGDIYLRLPRMFGRSGIPPLLRVSADGKNVTTFSFSALNDPALKGSSFPDFAVSLDGVVYALAQTPGNKTYVVQFDDQGQLFSTTRLIPPFSFYAMRLAVFPSGDFPVTGVRPGSEGEMTGQPFTAVFDASGNMVKQVRLPGDVTPGTSPVQGTAGLAASTGAAVVLGEAVPAEDGNVYLSRSGAQSVVYVISPAGEVLRRMALSPPQNELRPGPLKVSGGRLAVEFFSLGDPNQNNLDLLKQTHIYSIYDAATGERLLDYAESPKLRGAFACYTPSYFSFVGGSGGRSYVVQAIPK